MVTLVFSNHSYFIFSVDFVSEICYNKNTESEVIKMNAADFFKILDNLKIFGEYYDGNTHYWTDRKFDDDGNAYTLIIADIPHEKFTEQITCKVKEL